MKLYVNNDNLNECYHRLVKRGQNKLRPRTDSDKYSAVLLIDKEIDLNFLGKAWAKNNKK
jgi:hypothetical protein